MCHNNYLVHEYNQLFNENRKRQKLKNKNTSVPFFFAIRHKLFLFNHFHKKLKKETWKKRRNQKLVSSKLISPNLRHEYSSVVPFRQERKKINALQKNLMLKLLITLLVYFFFGKVLDSYLTLFTDELFC